MLIYSNTKDFKRTYCSTIGYEFMHMGDPDEEAWIRNRIEGPEKYIFYRKWKKAILKKIIQQKALEILTCKVRGHQRVWTRWSESLIPALEQIIKRGGI